MTRINTNISSLNGQKSLARNTQDLQKALTRLSTGLRINSGKDDPAGLIAAEILHNNIVATEKAISNTQRGNQMIATTDSALGSIGGLLHDVRSLVTEAANTAVMSDEQIAANQLQVDSALEAINRIAQVTKFQGRRVLDGSLDFVTDANTIPQIENLKIDQANLGATGEMPVAVEVETAATKADITTSSGESNAEAKLYFGARTKVALTATNAANDGDIYIQANSLSEEFDGVTVAVDNNATAIDVSYDAGEKILSISFDNDASTIADILQNITDTGLFTAYTDSADTSDTADAISEVAFTQDYVTVTAADKGVDFNDVKIKVEADTSLVEEAPTATYDSNAKEITVKVASNATDVFDNGYVTMANIATAIDGLTDFGAAASTAGTYVFGSFTSDTMTKATTGASGYLKSAFSDATRAQATIDFAAGVMKSFVGTAGDQDVYIKAKSLGSAYDQVDIEFVNDASAAGSETAEWDASAKSLIVHYKAGASTINQVIDAIDATGEWDAVLKSGETGTDTMKAATTQTAVRTGIDTLTVEAIEPGANFNNMQVLFEAKEGQGLTTPTAKYDRDANTFTITVDYDADDPTTLEDIADAIDSVEGFASYYVDDGIGRMFGGGVDATAIGNSGSSGGNTLLDDLVLEVAGTDGMEVFTFNEGTTSNQVAAAINAVSDAIGAEATQNNELITIKSNKYGSDAFVALSIIEEGSSGMMERSVSGFRETGTDVVAKINGVQATADGNKMWINTSMLDMTIDLAAETTDDFKFSITGGGAQFQLGPDVVTNQQIRMGIQSLNTARLGGVNGKMFQLQTGGSADLSTDPNQAAKIVGDAIDVVTELRGRLGALQSLTMDTNIKTMEDTLENMIQAESEIRDADFAVETANLTRSQVLVQSGTTVLSIANQNPRNILSLLG